MKNVWKASVVKPHWRGRTRIKVFLLAGTAFLALAASAPAARAQRVNFTYTGKLVTFTVPETGSYQILAFGAQGGNGTYAGPIGVGGLGAEIGGHFTLTAGEILQIAVGGAGGDHSRGGGGGGGGSFVVGPGDTPLVIAGGGGGGGGNGSGLLPGGGGLTGPNGGGQFGGTNGSGGGVAPTPSGGAGGGGFFSAGGNGVFASSTGGGAFPGLAGGESGGGFGGGGGASAGAGGGGGYSGGGGGFRSPGANAPGGGGGSFDAGTDQILVADLQTGNGEVVITKLSPAFAGTPGKANCHGKSVSALDKQYGGVNAAAAALGFASVKTLQDAIKEFCEA